MPHETKAANGINNQRCGSSPARRPALSVVLAVGIGGALGTLARNLIGRTWATSPEQFPWATLIMNVSGALVLAVVATLVAERWPPTRYLRPLVGIGICGAYTTWSMFMTETVLLVRDRHPALAAVYLAASVLTGLAATVCGIWIGRLWPAQARRST